MDYNAPSFSTDADADYVGKSGSTVGSAIPPNVPTLTQREIVNAEKCGGVTPSNGDRTQLAQAIGRGLWLDNLGVNPNVLVGALGGGVGGTKPGILQVLKPWTRFRAVALQTNTSVDVTVTISGVGTASGVVTAPLRKRDGTTKPAIGDVPVLRPFEIQWDGTYFCFLGSVASDGAGGVTPAALGAVGSVFNAKTFETTTRNSLNGTGEITAVSGWSYTKQSATSLVKAILTATSFVANGTSYSAAYLKLTIGSVTKIGTVSSYYTSVGGGPDIIARDFAGLAANTPLAIGVIYGRADGQTWANVICPTTSDSAPLPGATPVTLTLWEQEP